MLTSFARSQARCILTMAALALAVVSCTTGLELPAATTTPVATTTNTLPPTASAGKADLPAEIKALLPNQQGEVLSVQKGENGFVDYKIRVTTEYGQEEWEFYGDVSGLEMVSAADLPCVVAGRLSCVGEWNSEKSGRLIEVECFSTNFFKRTPVRDPQTHEQIGMGVVLWVKTVDENRTEATLPLLIQYVSKDEQDVNVFHDFIGWYQGRPWPNSPLEPVSTEELVKAFPATKRIIVSFLPGAELKEGINHYEITKIFYKDNNYRITVGNFLEALLAGKNLPSPNNPDWFLIIRAFVQFVES